MNKGTK